ncbi:MAG TPA: PEP-CTERM sorting domain-containing protein [Bryobacteraceae bacterium]|nr:PEP-CTERM sorting domain-containing protein [Bryobacteraceae bacterium]
MTYLAAIGLWAGMGVTRAHADGLFGPVLPYTAPSDSPFSSMSFSSFKLIKMTDLLDGTFSVPGVNAVGDGLAVIGPGSLVDSVDGGNLGHSLFADPGADGITFTFDAAVLGSLPTAAGIAWTDGDFVIHFSAIDANGNPIGPTINDTSGCDFSTCGDGKPKNYRFFGAIDSIGIKSITISNDFGGIEVDHLQFGVLAPNGTVPEPSTLLLLGTGLVAVAGRLKRKGLLNRS